MSNETPAQTYRQKTNTLVRRITAFLKGRAKTLTVDANIDHGAPLFGKHFDGEARTYTRDEVIAAVNRMVELCRNPETGKPHGQVAGAFDAKGRAALTGAPAAARITTQVNRGGTNVLVAHLIGPFRGEKHKHAAADAFRRATKGDDLVVYTVTGVPGEWTSKRHAVKAGAKALFPNAWKAANKMADADEATAERKAIKARVPVLANGKATTATRKPKSTAAPAATVNMSAAQAKTMAATMGATAAECKTKKTAVAFLRTRGLNV